MPVEKSAGAVVFYRGPAGKIEYLLIKSGVKGIWGFPKGLIEEGEDLKGAALREVAEETGLKDLVLVEGFKETVKYFFKVKYDYQLQMGYKIGEAVLKFATYFLTESKTKNVKLSFEHSEYIWLEFDEAYRRALSRKQHAEILKKAQEFLMKHD